MAAHTALPPPIESETALYREMTARNAGVVEERTQELLRTATILVAGCGSIGGAAVEPLARLGVRSFVLADPGAYELNNLNRQNATSGDLGRNKAQVAAERLQAVFPGTRAQVFSHGVAVESVDELIAGCDVVVDGVDVTTAGGLQAKYLLHERAAERRLPLVTGWDMAGAQYVRCYDYRRIRRVFDGQVSADDVARLDTWQLLQRLVPARYVPVEMLRIARANLENPAFSFPQIVYAADLFGAICTHVVARLFAGQRVREHIYIDLHQAARPTAERWRTRLRRPVEAGGLLTRLRRTTTSQPEEASP